jgi:hypothetical protein
MEPPMNRREIMKAVIDWEFVEFYERTIKPWMEANKNQFASRIDLANAAMEKFNPSNSSPVFALIYDWAGYLFTGRDGLPLEID